MSYLQILRLAAPETIIVVAALGVLTFGLVSDRARILCPIVAAIGILAAIFAILKLPPHANLFGGMLVVSPLNSLFKIVCLVLALVTIPLAAGEKSLPNPGEYIALLLLGSFGLMLLVGSEELLMIFIGLELLGLSLYVMTAFDKIDIRSAEAGLKYFLFGSTASAFTLFGISLVYGMSGTTALAPIAQKLAGASLQPLLAVAVVMTLIGFAFKIAAAPFHLWAPDAYQGAPVPSAAFIASGSKVASFVVLGKIVLIGFAPIRGSADWHAMLAGWSPVLAALAALSILLGNFVALAQTNVRRLLAYSAVAHGGYTLLGIIAGGREGFSAALFYTSIYAVTLVGAFAVVQVVRRETGGDDLLNFAGLVQRSPLLAATMSIFLLSLAGLPPLAGFFGKFYLFSVAFRSGANHGLLWLVALALFGSFVSLYYYLIPVKVMFVDRPSDAESHHPSLITRHWVSDVTIATLAIAVLFFGLMPQTLAERIIASLP
ncbi:MAG TPA: NADH-quinone oxidoreductase subunit N [Chthoniobacterales bacterium]|jgi:NADH-quinone oxidoreductase subunit N|nr:NADH-quinone oxidoreductase subunit N [Chthoniobacterales bacterium]